MKAYEKLFEDLWSDYIQLNPSAKKIYDLFDSEGETIVNDHIALRTFNHPMVNIETLAEPFVKIGYRAAGDYHFKEKKLLAKHYEIPDDPSAPRIFISELLLDEFSDYLQDEVKKLLQIVKDKNLDALRLLFSGSVFGIPSWDIYNRLRDESEYASWIYVFGYRANHFTLSVNHFTKYNSLEEVNKLLRDRGFLLNSSGGEIKGTEKDLLRQSSTMADLVNIEFIEGNYLIPACYYEFAQRYPDENGKLYSGFIAKSADKIFESTNFYKKS